jgi:hypothetical protein
MRTNAPGRTPAAEAPRPDEQGCDHPECAAAGLYRAPKARDRLKDYYWFCLDHVRAYNSAWNFCAGFSEADIEAQVRAASCWERPTWRLGDWHSPCHTARVEAAMNGFAGAFGVNGGVGENPSAPKRPFRPRTPEEQALAVLDLTPAASWAEIKACYKGLVKRFHPDANGGDKQAEERLKVINQAYSTLRSRALS